MNRRRLDLGNVLGVGGILVAMVSLAVSIVAMTKASSLSERQLAQEQAIAARDLPQISAVFYLERYDEGGSSGTQDKVFAAGGLPPTRRDFISGKHFMLDAVLTNAGKQAASVTWWTLDLAPERDGTQTVMARRWPTSPTTSYGSLIGPPPIRLEPFSQTTVGIDLSEIIDWLRDQRGPASINPDNLQMRVTVAAMGDLVGTVPFRIANVPQNFGR